MSFFSSKQDSDGDQDADLSTSTLQNTVTEGESTLVEDDADSKQSVSDTLDCTAGTGKSLEKDAAVAADKEEEGSLPWKTAFNSFKNLIIYEFKLMRFYRWQILEETKLNFSLFNTLTLPMNIHVNVSWKCEKKVYAFIITKN